MRKQRPGGVGAEAAAAEGEKGVEAGSLAQCSQASSLCEDGGASPPPGGDGPEFTESPGPARREGHLQLGTGGAGTVMLNLKTTGKVTIYRGSKENGIPRGETA